MTDFTPLRSVLYMPSSNERALEKAKSIACDGLILDLEDAVAPDAKEAARETACAAAASGEYGRRTVTIRANGIGTQWHDADLAAIAQAGPDAVVVPKVNSADEVHQLVTALEKAGAPDHTKLWAMIETPIAILDVLSIARASERLTCFVMGTNDLVKELGAEHTPDRVALTASLGLCLLAARAEGLVCVDGVHNAFQDQAGLRAACVQGRAMGFDGKTLIHPDQIAVANEVFAPSAGELARAEAEVAAFGAAEARGEGVAVVEGRIVENLHVATARQLLARAAAIAALEGAS
jgi:citrate lyase subunit beta/citryl-CoA lyase